ncbi:MAG: hypothetical protein HPY72_12625 [Anaerolineae bacterium]|nr:hypothetical protein [Anaerolineae bacterium]
MCKKLVCILIIVLLSACARKGEEGGKCLTGGICSQPDLRCARNGTCQKCGIEGRQCCAGSTCSEMLTCTGEGYCEKCGFEGEKCCSSEPRCIGSICGNDEVCRQCGDEGEVCCPGLEVACKRGYCNTQGICVASDCDAQGKCIGCGSPLTPCCAGGRCNEITFCSPENICQPCGSIGEPPCAANSCRGWLRLSEGICDSPFQEGRPEDVSICLRALAGHEDKSRRDWCYWYLAFQTKDPSHCDSVEWQDAKSRCLEGADPEDYSIQTVIDFNTN